MQSVLATPIPQLEITAKVVNDALATHGPVTIAVIGTAVVVSAVKCRRDGWWMLATFDGKSDGVWCTTTKDEIARLLIRCGVYSI